MSDIERIRRYVGSQEWIYERLRPYLMTGDVVLCRGRGLISAGIRLFTQSPYTHIGDIVRTSYEIQLFHSGYTNAIRGVQLTPFGEYVRGYNGLVEVRFLQCNRSREWYERLHNFIRRVRGTSYEKGAGGLLELIGAALRINRKNLNEMFCSEKQAELWRRFGWLPAGASNNYLPKDWLPGGLIDARLREASVILGEEITLGPLQRISS